jgi:isopenicillin-N N-acyltransferase like protein
LDKSPLPYPPATGSGTPSTLRLLRVSGNGDERGKAHGEEFRDLINDTLHQWRESLEKREQMPPDRYIGEFLSSTGFAASAETLSPDLYAEVKGIAAGSGERFEDILVYNLMDEEWRFERDPVIGCSTIGTYVDYDGASDQAPVLGQNMDLPASMGDSQIVLQIEGKNDPDQIVLSGAGMIGLLGVNAAGLAVCVNTLRALPAAAEGLPVAFVIRELLRRASSSAAADYLRSIPHASGQHYGLGDPDGFRGFECSAEGCVEGPVSPHLLHTNHVLWAPYEDQASGQAQAYEQHGTHTRMASLDNALNNVTAFGDMQNLLSTTATGLCVLPTPSRQVTTFCAAEFLLTVPPVVRVAPGRPDEAEWHNIAWIDGQQRR